MHNRSWHVVAAALLLALAPLVTIPDPGRAGATAPQIAGITALGVSQGRGIGPGQRRPLFRCQVGGVQQILSGGVQHCNGPVLVMIGEPVPGQPQPGQPLPGQPGGIQNPVNRLKGGASQ